MSEEPRVRVGVMSATTIQFVLHGKYSAAGIGTVTGPQSATVTAGGLVSWNGLEMGSARFDPTDEETCSVELADVTIGVNFHWERRENQRFRGSLHIIVENGTLTAVNVLRVEDYLMSVISSEMSATASIELLKAHAVISRSWLLAQMDKSRRDGGGETLQEQEARDGELIRWWDRDDHQNFDVCADDHCQRYQGITRETTHTVREAVEATRGQALTYDGQLCDARFSKCCGGVLEQFENCWEPKRHDYLTARRDSEREDDFPDLTKEPAVEEWIMGSPDAFCNTTDTSVLSQALNSYDQETTDFYRWRVEYGQKELSELIKRRSGVDYGDIIDLQPVARGTSGRLYKLKIVGTKATRTIGKELEIRRTLSPTHLYSSAFIVERHNTRQGVPQKFVLRGAGWGHGVGLCQIGAAVMAERGYSYRDILLHYFVNANIENLY